MMDMLPMILMGIVNVALIISVFNIRRYVSNQAIVIQYLHGEVVMSKYSMGALQEQMEAFDEASD